MASCNVAATWQKHRTFKWGAIYAFSISLLHTIFHMRNAAGRANVTSQLPHPLSGPAPERVPLPESPLVCVLAQVRFPTILAIRSPDKVASFQEAIRGDYPVLEKEEFQDIAVQSNGQVLSSGADMIWRFHNERKRGWRVSLGTGFVALETNQYTDRHDFLARLQTILAVTEEVLNPRICTRFGIRYIDRVVKPAGEMRGLLKEWALGVAGEEPGRFAHHTLTEAAFPTEEGGTLQARWGGLPKNGTVDPALMAPIDEPSWLLDLDMWDGNQRPFSSGPLSEMSGAYTNRVYSVFRWIVNDDFLRAHGARL